MTKDEIKAQTAIRIAERTILEYYAFKSKGNIVLDDVSVDAFKTVLEMARRNVPEKERV